MVELFKMYRFSSGLYTIPLQFSDDGFYIDVIEISRFKDVAAMDRVVVRDPYDEETTNIFEVDFDNLDSVKKHKVLNVLFRGKYGWI